jgi:hypothetical protein
MGGMIAYHLRSCVAAVSLLVVGVACTGISNRRTEMASAELTVQALLEDLPQWSRTIDPARQVDRRALVSSAISFLEMWPEIHARYRLTDGSPVGLRADGVPSDVVEKVVSAMAGEAFDRDGLSAVLGRALGAELRGTYEASVRRHTEVWRTQLARYHSRYCFPQFDERRASAIYLFFRVIFDLPSSYPIDQAKVFGGWLHPSVDPASVTFDLSWPVVLSQQPPAIEVERYVGYFGKGYDCLGEFDYFLERFPFRNRALLQDLLKSLQ